jgi:hypothetical protein
MTRQRIRRCVFRSIARLQAAISAILAEHNASPKPLVWTKSSEATLPAVPWLVELGDLIGTVASALLGGYAAGLLRIGLRAVPQPGGEANSTAAAY